jgi:hypothetical protein
LWPKALLWFWPSRSLLQKEGREEAFVTVTGT